MNGTYSIVYSPLQNITNHLISEGNTADAIFGGEICSSSKQPIQNNTSVYQRKRVQVCERTGFFSNLTYGIDHLIQKIIFMSYLVSSKKLKFELLVAFVRLIKVFSFCNESQVCSSIPCRN